jgi:hypothetical protein
MKVARLSALRTDRLYHQKIFLVRISVRSRVDSRAMVDEHDSGKKLDTDVIF